MIFELIEDFAATLRAMPPNHPRRQTLKLLDEAIRRDAHFIERHPTTLFQCLWNSCWWYDCPQAADHFDPPEAGWPTDGPPWFAAGDKLCSLLETWRETKCSATPGFPWLRSLRPPDLPLGCGQAAVLRGHTQHVMSIACSPDGRIIATGSGDCTVRLWSSPHGSHIATLSGHETMVTTVAWSPDGNRLASAAHGSSIHIWDIQRKSKIGSLPADCFRMAWSPDGLRLAVACSDGKVRVWLVEQSALLGEYEWEQSTFLCVAWSENSEELYAGTNSGAICCVNVQGGTLRQLESIDSAFIWHLAHLPDGRLIAVSSADGGIAVIPVGDAESRVALAAPGFFPHRIAMSADGSTIAAGSLAGGVCVWPMINGAEGQTLGSISEPVFDVALSPDGALVMCAVGTQDDLARIFATGGNPPPKPKGHESIVRQVCWSPDGTQFFSTGFDKVIHRWNGDDATLLGKFAELIGPVKHMEVSADGKNLITSMAGDTADDVWEIATGYQIESLMGPNRVRPRRREPVAGYEIEVHHTAEYRETLVYRTSPRTDVAWYATPTTSGELAEHPAGGRWACPHENTLLVLSLEGMAAHDGESGTPG